MRIKVFTAPKLHEALAMVRQQLGPEAIILDRQQVRDASGASIWHVHAALDAGEHEAPAVASPRAEHHSTEATVRRLERILEGLSRRETSSLRDSLSGAGERQAFDHLLQLGVSPNHAFDLAGDIAEGRPAGVKMLSWGRRPDFSRGQNRLLFCGPAGAGKTTLIAKIAAHYSLKGISVALISTDTERMGGLETLEGYAATLGIELHVLRRPDQAASILKRADSAQLLLIDSEGWSPRHGSSLKRQSALWRELGCRRRFLVVPANMDEEDGMQLIARSNKLGVSDIAFTKLDETHRPGKIVNWSMMAGLPLGYCSFGPEVPEQMGWLTPKGMASILGRQEISPRNRVTA